MERIKEMNNYLPREKMQKFGTSSLTDVELMAIILKTGYTDNNVFQLSEELIHRIHSEQFPFQLTVEELISIKGVGLSKATSILAGIELGRRLQKRYSREKIKIDSPNSVYEYVKHEVAYLDKEHFCALYFNTKNEIISFDIISQGTLNQTIVHPREVFKSAIKKSANSIIIVHNHPSGDTSPSREDLMITKRLVECGDILGIRILDHLIVAEHSYISLKQEKYME